MERLAWSALLQKPLLFKIRRYHTNIGSLHYSTNAARAAPLVYRKKHYHSMDIGLCCLGLDPGGAKIEEINTNSTAIMINLTVWEDDFAGRTV